MLERQDLIKAMKESVEAQRQMIRQTVITSVFILVATLSAVAATSALINFIFNH
jgi:hypothetical protein